MYPINLRFSRICFFVWCNGHAGLKVQDTLSITKTVKDRKVQIKIREELRSFEFDC